MLLNRALPKLPPKLNPTSSFIMHTSIPSVWHLK